MKVYDKIVIDIATGKVIAEYSFDYDGPILRLNSKKKKAAQVEVPQASAAETALQQEQTTLLREQRDAIQESARMQDLLSPMLYKAAGITPITAGQRLQKAYEGVYMLKQDDPNDPRIAALEKDIAALEANPEDPGKIIGFSQNPEEAAAAETVDPEAARIEQLFQERTLAALEGKLPIDPSLLSELDKQEKTLREQLFKQLGTGYETSTPGQDVLNKFQKTKAELLSSASRGDLTLAETLGISREDANARAAAANQMRVGDFISRIAGINQIPLSTASAYGSAASGYNNPLAFLQNNRQQQLQANMFNVSQRNAPGASSNVAGILGGAGGAMQGLGSLWSAFGSSGASSGIGSMGSSIYSGIGSSRDFKDNIEAVDLDRILRELESTPVYTWNYKPEWHDSRQHIGPVVEESPARITSGKVLVNQDMLGFLFAAVKALHEKLKQLEN